MLKYLIQVALLPAWLLGAGLVSMWAHQKGWSMALIVPAIGAASFLVATLLERTMPYRPDWKPDRVSLSTDLASFGMLAVLVDPVAKMLGASMALGLAVMLGPKALPLFPVDAPLGIQILLVFLTGEFGRYWAHRWHHESSALWNFHAMHHAPTQLYAMNNFRLHPVNHFINYGIGLLPLVMLGAPDMPLLVYASVMIAMNFFQHANIDFKFGPLNYVLSTNALHRWHHSATLPEGNRNYGSVLIIWDLVFGTYHPVQAPHAPARIGIDGGDYPEHGYVRQLIWPWRACCCSA